MDIYLNNVTGAHNNCFFNAATAALGHQIMRTVFKIPEPAALTSRAIRASVTGAYTMPHFLSHYKTIYNVVQVCKEAGGLDEREIRQSVEREIPGIEPSVFNCVYDIAQPGVPFDDVIATNIRECAALTFVFDCPMISDIEVSPLVDYLRKKHHIHLMVLPIDDAVVAAASGRARRHPPTIQIVSTAMYKAVAHPFYNTTPKTHHISNGDHVVFLILYGEHYRYLSFAHSGHPPQTRWTRADLEKFIGIYTDGGGEGLSLTIGAVTETVIAHSGGARKRRRAKNMGVS
jgi:hypothetical protein